ncbi:unnamed protein product [Phytophthora fragariaefolia]|uniref:Unnamed protein product n=1 Tax=Phytophthora fragariaefolia TaxID=1490495 RepID=A0A9W6XSQ1_9STRA|nr:unnamed protein product [Phytophthora fragariaefolia]
MPVDVKSEVSFFKTNASLLACSGAAGSLYNLESEAKPFGSMAKRIDDFSQLATTEDLCATMIEHDMNRIYPTLYRLVCALSVTSAGVERTFSAMKRVQTGVRTILGDAWLANLLLLTLKSDLTKTIDKDAVIEAFNKMAHHRVPKKIVGWLRVSADNFFGMAPPCQARAPFQAGICFGRLSVG